MVTEPCQRMITAASPEKGKTVEFYIDGWHTWGSWETLKEEACFTKTGCQTNLQSRECLICGLLQQRKVRI